MHPELIRAIAEQQDRDRRERLTSALRTRPHGRVMRWLRKIGASTVEAGAVQYDTDAAPLPEPFSRHQVDEMAAEQGVRFPHSHGPHTVG